MIEWHTSINNFLISTVTDKTGLTGWSIEGEDLLKSGFGVNSDGIRLYTLKHDAQILKICVKTYKPSTHPPREVLYFEEVSKYVDLVSLFANYYGATIINGAYSIAIAYLEKCTRSFHGNFARTHALAELASFYYSPTVLDFIVTVRSHQVKTRNMIVRDEIRHLIIYNLNDGQEVLNNLDSLERYVKEKAKNKILLPGLAHGDAQLPNSIVCLDEKVRLIDIGTMRIAPAGYDLAKLCFSIALKDMSEEIFVKKMQHFETAFFEKFKQKLPIAKLENIHSGALVGVRDLTSQKLYRLSIMLNTLSAESSDYKAVLSRQLSHVRMLAIASRLAGVCA